MREGTPLAYGEQRNGKWGPWFCPIIDRAVAFVFYPHMAGFIGAEPVGAHVGFSYLKGFKRAVDQLVRMFVGVEGRDAANADLFQDLKVYAGMREAHKLNIKTAQQWWTIIVKTMSADGWGRAVLTHFGVQYWTPDKDRVVASGSHPAGGPPLCSGFEQTSVESITMNAEPVSDHELRCMFLSVVGDSGLSMGDPRSKKFDKSGSGLVTKMQGLHTWPNLGIWMKWGGNVDHFLEMLAPRCVVLEDGTTMRRPKSHGLILVDNLNTLFPTPASFQESRRLTPEMVKKYNALFHMMAKNFWNPVYLKSAMGWFWGAGPSFDVAAEHLAQLFDVSGVADEGRSHVVHVVLGGEDQVFLVLEAHGPELQIGVGKVHALPAAQGASPFYLADHPVSLDGRDDQADAAVIDQDRVPRSHGPGELRIRRRDPGAVVAVGIASFGMEDEVLAGLQIDQAVLDLSDADLDAPGIEHRGHHPTGARNGAGEPIEPRPMLLGRAVREVKPSHVHAGLDHGREDGRIVAGGAQGRDDLGLANALARRHEALSPGTHSC
jgi:hypothetical protein